MAEKPFKIVTFYEFKPLGDLPARRARLIAAMRAHSILGTIILAAEGFNSTVAGAPGEITRFVAAAEEILETKIVAKSSAHDVSPFRRIHVKIKPEIVTLRRAVDLRRGAGTHVAPEKWNELLRDEEVFVLDTRNDYEFRIGTFDRAVNPQTEKFSDLPQFVAENLDPARHRKVAMFCTGGIRCEKFAPYLKEQGFAEVYQLEGGILKYLETVPAAESLWRGECYVFDRRVALDAGLEAGSAEDLSVKLKNEKPKAR